MTDGKYNSETLFMNWLAEQVSPAQLSELYMLFKDIEDECKKKHVIKTSLFECSSADEIRKIRASVEGSKLFRYIHKKESGRIASAFKYLLQYVQTSEEAKKQKLEGTINAVPNNSKVEPPDIAVDNVETDRGTVATVDLSAQADNSEPTDTVEQTTENRLKTVLQQESDRNQYGSTLYYLAKSAELTVREADKILTAAPWATKQYGRYFYSEPELVPDAVPEMKTAQQARASRRTVQIEQEDLEAAVESVLKRRCQMNNYGVTPGMIRSVLKSSSAAEIQEILDRAPWAAYKYGRYYYSAIDHQTNQERDAAKDKLEERIRDALELESSNNSNGTTPLDIRLLIGTSTSRKIEEILRKVPWAKQIRIGYYIYVPTGNQNGSPQDYGEKKINKERAVISQGQVGTQQKSGSIQTPISTTDASDGRSPISLDSFHEYMVSDRNLSERTAQNYCASIRMIEQYIHRNHLNISIINATADNVQAVVDSLIARPDFVVINDSRHHQFSAALSQLVTYLTQTTTVTELIKGSKESLEMCAEVESDQSAPNNEIDIFLAGDEFAPLRNALSVQHITTIDKLKSIKLWPFMNRHNVYSIGMRQTILSKVNALLYPAVEIDDSRAYIMHVGDSCYKGFSPAEAFRQYCDDMLSRYPLQIRLLIGMRTQTGAVPIFKDEGGAQSLKLTNLSACIRSDLSEEDVIAYTNWVQNRCGEDPVDVTISEPAQPGERIEQALPDDSGNDHSITVSLYEQETPVQEPALESASAYVEQIEGIVLSADMQGMSYDEAKNAMNISMVATRHAVADSEHIVYLKGRLVHEDAFVDWEDGADQLEAIIDKLMQKNGGYISATQLYEYAKVEMNMFLTDNDIRDERSVYDIASHLFDKKNYHNKHYIFSGKLHISRPDHPITSNFDIIRNYAIEQGGFFSFDSLVEYLRGIGVATGNLRAQMRMPDEPFFFYYDSGILMSAESLHIDKAWKTTVMQALTALFSDVGNNIILRTVPQNWLERLPALPGSRSWTPLLVQSVLRCYGKEFGAKTIQALSGQSFDTVHAMLVANDSPVQTFGDAVISYLVDNEISKRSFDAEELRQLLVDSKMIQGNELIWNMPKVLNNDERFAWNASGDHVTVEV